MNLTLCFVKYQDKIVMINRNKKPFMGMWNALGGHQEENESIDECAIREIYEESNIKVNNIKLISVSYWNFDDIPFYVYLAEVDELDCNKYPYVNDEGIIDLKEISWLIDRKNVGVVPDIKIYINDISSNDFKDYYLTYDEKGNLLDVKVLNKRAL